MGYALFIFILMVAVVTSDVTSTNQHQQQNVSMGVDSNIDDVSNRTDDVTDNSTNNDIPHKQVKTSDDIVECSISSVQYNNIKNRLMELALQLELLQTAVDKLDQSASSATVTGIYRLPTHLMDEINVSYHIIIS